MKRIRKALWDERRNRLVVLAVALVAAGLLAASCGGDDAEHADSADLHPSEGRAEAAQHMESGHAGDQTGSFGTGGEAIIYGCACCPDVRSTEPGDCPECNMELTPIDSAHDEMMHGGEEAPPEPVHPETGDVHDTEADLWTCGMHPAIRSEQPGKCPICNMDLVPVAAGDGSALKIDGESLELVGARRAQAEYLPLVRVIWAVGKVEYDERLVKYVPSRVPGRVERLHADFVGTDVYRDQPLLEIYSPELITALAEYEAAMDAARSIEPGARAGGSGVEGLARSAKTRLRLWGLDDEEIDRLVADGATTSHRVPVRSPISGTVIGKTAFEGKYVREGENLFTVADLSRVWITADLYEDDIAHVKPGDRVVAETRSYPGEVFEGRVAFIDPYVDEKTRAAKIRMELRNPGMRLKPGMYVEAGLEAPVSRSDKAVWMCPMHPEVTSDGPGECPVCNMYLERIEAGRALAVPEDAVVHAGETAVVYVETGPGAYQARRLVLDRAATLKGGGDVFYPVLDGLTAGETVITDAPFLVHSQARLTGQAASAYGGALDVDTGGHSHGR